MEFFLPTISSTDKPGLEREEGKGWKLGERENWEEKCCKPEPTQR